MSMRIQQFKSREDQSEYLFYNNAEELYVMNNTDTHYIYNTAWCDYREDVAEKA